MTIKMIAPNIDRVFFLGFLVFLTLSQNSYCMPMRKKPGVSDSSSEIDLPEFRMMYPGDQLVLNSKPSQISLGLAWDPSTDETYVDVDLNLHVIKRSKKISAIVWYHNKKFRSSCLFGGIPCVEHTNNSITGDGDGDNESILCNLRNLSLFRRRVSHLVVSLTCYSNHWIHEVNEAVLRLRIPGKNGTNTEVAQLKLADCQANPTNGKEKGGKAILLLLLTKGKHGIWTIKTLGKSMPIKDSDQSAIAQDCDPHIIKLLKTDDLDI